MHPLLSRQLQQYMGIDFVVPDEKMHNLFKAISGHYRELEYLAHFDPLIGIANRRYFVEMGEAEMVRSSRYDKPLSILMIDVDKFKEVNDVYGHQAGDVVLQALCETCKIVLRAVDIVGRLGGDEFAILLPETPPATALHVAERLRGAIENRAVDLEMHSPLYFSVSIGCASRNAKDDNMDTILNLADKALYDAKRTGRNRVCVAAQ
ncbi:MAG: PAS/PAC/GAF sensor-containing diguanylate [Gallionellaceae bacterium]|nr:MAG: PAS/PAC/GAF sensor-containing diguanylate [Gallionellaceae bacterium]